VRDSSVLVVGGGFSGVGAAAALVEAGVDVLLAEQGRGVGGRVATRHVRGSQLSFDHGAQYFAPRPGTAFHELLRALELDGSVARWGGGRLGTLQPGGGSLLQTSFRPWDASKEAFVGVPSNSVVGRAILQRAAAASGAGRLTVAAGTRVAPGSLRRADDGRSWLVDTHPKATPQAATTTRHGFVLACGSASSTYNIVSPTAPLLAAAAKEVKANPCWALMVAFARPLFPLPRAWDGALVEGSPDISWLACDSSKPRRAPGAEAWVVHAAPGFDTATDIPAAGGGGGEAAAAALLAALLRAAGAPHWGALPRAASHSR
jgi:predicted NAD/FAD-dependent oxidoreductase